ncbi:hypothetical protein ABLG96_19535 [Nakamurella sp. A5-74]|uniref:Uncharacterized protein n=1 Tax=Nakamurella sp. A5-74 TaxID=3158264 RepID=A0AAU8DNJ5_9ACTN
MDLENVKTIAVWATVAFVVIGLLAAIIIKKVIGKIISLVLAAVIVFFLWQQRGKVESFANDVHGDICSSQPSFFGISVDLPTGWCTGA